MTNSLSQLMRRQQVNPAESRLIIRKRKHTPKNPAYSPMVLRRDKDILHLRSGFIRPELSAMHRRIDSNPVSPHIRAAKDELYKRTPMRLVPSRQVRRRLLQIDKKKGR